MNIVDIGKGEPDFHTPDHIKRAGHAAIDENFTKYTPQPGIPELRDAIALKLKNENRIDASSEQIVVTCGGKHAVDYAVRAIVRPGDEVIMVKPYWFAYPDQVRLAGGSPVLVTARAENQYVPDPADIRAAVTGKTRLVIINTPNNPTGAVYQRAVLKEIAQLAMDHGLMVLADEVYEKLVFDRNEHVSLASLSPEIAAHTVTVNSVSKTHAMTGWRIGYGVFPGQWAARVTSMQGVSTSAPCAISQRAALAAFLGDQTHVSEMTKAYAERRAWLLQRLSRLPVFSAVAPAGTFYCFTGVSGMLGKKVGGRLLDNAGAVTTALRETAGVSVVSGAGFGAPNHIRISFAVSIDALREGFERIERFRQNDLEA